MFGLGACRSKKWRVVGFFLPTPHGSVQMILWRNLQFPSQTKYGGLVRETEPENTAWTFWYIWVAWWVNIVRDPNRWWCILWNLAWKEFLLFCMTSFSQIQKKSNAFFPKSFKKKSFNVFSSWICLFLGSEKKTEWSWYEIFRKKLVRIQDWMAMNYDVIEKGKASPRVRKLNHWKVQLSCGTGTFFRGDEEIWNELICFSSSSSFLF